MDAVYKKFPIIQPAATCVKLGTEGKYWDPNLTRECKKPLQLLAVGVISNEDINVSKEKQ